MKCNVALGIFVLVAGASARSLQSDSERPVMKVVRLLQDMKAELEKEKADDEAVFQMLDCWCKKNEDEKTLALETNRAKASDLKAAMAEFAAKIEEIREGLASTKEKLRQDQEALDTATALRMKEVKAFHAEETDLIGVIQSCKQAIVVLSKHNPSFTQLHKIAKSLDAMRTMQLAKDALSSDKLNVLKAFLQEAKESSANNLRRIPGFQSYNPQSSQIFGVLRQMQEEFEASLSEAQKEEAKAKEDYQALKAAKEAELAAGKKQQAQFEQDDAEFRMKNEQAYEEYNDTLDQIKIDETFLRNLKKKCSEKDEEFEKRTKDRIEEIKAVDDTIFILNSDAAFENFDKTVSTSFMQVSAKKRKSSLLKRAASVLRNVRGGSVQLAALAVTVELDGFEKAKAAIDKMVADLTKQQSEEVKHKDWCQNEMQDNAVETEAKDDHKTNLQTSISDLTQTIEKLTKEIEANKKAIAETQAEMKKASEIREGENADFQQTVLDQRITQAILQKAIDRMSQVYGFLQKPGAPHIQTSGTHTDPGNGPAKFTKYEENAGGKRVIAMLDTVMADSKKMENDAIRSEQDAAASYEMFMKDSNKSIAQMLRSNVNMSEEKAKSEEAISRDEKDLKATMKTLESLNEELGDLHRSCDFVLKNFDARQKARGLEIDALREAKAILSGMK
jgi:DNA repair exonuclease SbcCD ATPase subunit